MPVKPSKTSDDPQVALWFKRKDAAETVQASWEDEYRVDDCYAYWKGHQREEPLDAQHERKAQINLVHPQVRAQLPALYFYRPFGRVTAQPERADTPQSVLPEKSQLLQDMGNYFVRDPETKFRESTFLALKESFWAFGAVEVGYSADFGDNPQATRPPLKEDEDTKVDGEEGAPEGGSDLDEDGLPLSPAPDAGPGLAPVAPPAPPAESVEAEIKRLRDALKGETFYVKFISAKQILVSESDKAILSENDWIGYWEDYALEDIKRSKIYKNVRNLKPSTGKKKPDAAATESDNAGGELKPLNPDDKSSAGGTGAKKIRLYKLWDLRTKTKVVLADGHKKFLLKEPFKRCGLKFHRPDIDPYHFRPRPPIFNGLGEQDIHNDSYEYLRRQMKSTKSRWTYDEKAIKREEIEKFEKDDVNYIPRGEGTVRPIEPVEHPQYTQLPLQTLSISERAFAQTTGVPAEARQAQTTGEKTATQATIQHTAAQVVDNFDRSTTAEWLASIIEELIALAIDHLILPRWIAINVDPDSPMAVAEAAKVAQVYRLIKAEDLEAAAAGVTWHVTVDVESISPVAEQDRLNRLLQTLNFIGNPAQAVILSQSPMLLETLLKLALGPQAGRDRDAVLQGLAAVVQMQAATAAAGAGQPRGVSPMAGLPSPAASVQATPPPGPPGAPPGPPGPVPVG